MLGDLTRLFEALEGASTEQEKLRRASQLDDAIERHLRAMFDDPAYPKRRRSLGALKAGLAIYDSDPLGLRTHLVRIGARRVRGDDDGELWELPEDGAETVSGGTRRRWALRTVFGLAILILIAQALGVTPTALRCGLGLCTPTCDPATMTPEEMDSCLADGGREPS